MEIERTKRLFLERKEYGIDKLDIFYIVVDHIIEFQSLELLRQHSHRQHKTVAESVSAPPRDLKRYAQVSMNEDGRWR